MDVCTLVLFANKANIPIDLLRYIVKFLYKKLENNNIRNAVELWFKDNNSCKLIYGQIEYWNTCNITNMNHLFFYCPKIDLNISKWNVRNVTDMNNMFKYCEIINLDLSKWNT